MRHNEQIQTNESHEQVAEASFGVALETRQALTQIDMHLFESIEDDTTDPKKQLFLAFMHLVEDGPNKNEALGRKIASQIDGQFLLDDENFDFGVDRALVLRTLFTRKIDDQTDEIDFCGNSSAERWIGCGDLYPEAWDGLEIDGELGIRAIDQKRGKVGYKTNGGTGKYLAVYSGGIVKKRKKLVVQAVAEEEQIAGVEYEKVTQDVLDAKKQEEQAVAQTFAQKVAAFEADNHVHVPAGSKAYETDAFMTYGDDVESGDVELGTFKYSEKYKQDTRTGGFNKPKMQRMSKQLIAKKYGSIGPSETESQNRSEPPGGEMNPENYSRTMHFGRGGRYKRTMEFYKRAGKLNGMTDAEILAQQKRYYEGLEKFERGDFASRDYGKIVPEVCAMNGIQETYKDIAKLTKTAAGRRRYVDACAKRMARGEYASMPERVAAFREYAPFIIEQCHKRGLGEYIPWMLSKIRSESGWKHTAALVDDVEDSHGFMQINMRAHKGRAAEMGLNITGNTLDNITYGIWLLAYQGAKFGDHPQKFFMGLDRYSGNNAWKAHPTKKGIMRVAKKVHYFVPSDAELRS